MTDSKREWHRVAIVVFCEAKGLDDHDAANGAMIAFNQNLRPGTTIVMRHGNPELDGSEVRICDHVEAGMAAGNGYLWQSPTGKAFRQHRFPWSPPESEE